MGGGHGGHDPFASFFGDFFGGGHGNRDEETPRVSFFFSKILNFPISFSNFKKKPSILTLFEKKNHREKYKLERLAENFFSHFSVCIIFFWKCQFSYFLCFFILVLNFKSPGSPSMCGSPSPENTCS